MTLALLVLVGVSVNAQEPSIKDLDAFIGTWNVEEATIADERREVNERGIRTCSYALSDTYISCETRSRFEKTGKERVYKFLINYNQVDKRFEMVGVYSNWGRKNLYTFTVQKEPLRLDLRGMFPAVENGIERRSWDLIEFEGKDKYTWTVRRNKSTDAPTEWPLLFQEVAMRQPK